MGLYDIVEAFLALVDRHPGSAIGFTVLGLGLATATAYGLFCLHEIRTQMVTKVECAERRADALWPHGERSKTKTLYDSAGKYVDVTAE
jgi:hypothetical protein